MTQADAIYLAQSILLAFLAAGCFIGVATGGLALSRQVAARNGDDPDAAHATAGADTRADPDASAGDRARPADLPGDESQLQFLGKIAIDMPFPCWVEDRERRVIWANPAYCALAGAPEDAMTGWPLPKLFAPRREPDSGTSAIRQAIDTVNGQQEWFEVHDRRTADGHRLRYAIPAGALVQAETALKGFVQTLTQTFAHLPIGLAVFDRDRRLAIFNPALSDLTGLPPDRLTARPTIQSFLDQLRNRQMTPEPRDFGSWRARIAALVQDAEQGVYEENWALPGGQTYRVTGRPHPQGAVALLFEDITTSVTLRRRVRSEIALSQNVLDSLNEGIAVLDHGGRLCVTNAAFTAMWGVSAEDTLAEIPLTDLLEVFIARSQPTPIWGDLRDFVLATSERTEWEGDITDRAGTVIACRFTPMPGHATLCRFSEVAESPHLRRPESARTTAFRS